MREPSNTATAVAVDVILRDGSTLRLRAPARTTMRVPSSPSSNAFPSAAATCGSTASGTSTKRSSSTFSSRIGSTAAHCSARSWTPRVTSMSSPWPNMRACAILPLQRSRSRWQTSFRAGARRPGCSSSSPRGRRSRNRAVRGRGAPRERGDARGLPRRGLRGVAHARRRRGRGAFPDRSDGAFPRPRRGARPRRGRRVAAAVLRAGRRRGDRRLEAPRLDRRRALSQHHRGRLRGRCISRQPRRRSGRRRTRVPHDRGDPRPGRSRRHLRTGRRACSSRRRRRCGRACPRSA